MAIESVREPVNGVEFKSSDASSLTNGSSLAETFDTFLTLLTTQLQYQDPLDPMDTNEFTSQLVEFTSVEQAISTNKKLDQLLALQDGMQLNDAVNYIGKTVGADGIILMLQDGQSTITYDLGANAAQANILVIDEQGNTVRTIDADTDVGHHEVVWDGLDDDGEPLEDGLYGFLVTAIDSEDNPVPLVQGTAGQVTGVKLVNGEVVLEIDDLEVALSDVLTIEQ
ncbi:flagellar hook assembly protein FlgD [Pelagibius marinus]|uniref:flagellar hook assembly protein FlgD n=1 Tax=Pelagibius marinus TaxID=2762760 RepID=UPI0018723980|nr:flagellar hook capping FlgD N-terminal domain-containing protein [Pelagibius marinus]